MQHSTLQDSQIEQVLNQLHRAANRQIWSLLWHYLPQLPRLLSGKGIRWNENNLALYNDKYVPIDRNQGHLLYLLARSIGANTIVEYGTSFGISTIYLAAAVRDNGGGHVIGTEIVPQKIKQAQQNIAKAGLSAYVEIRSGDALQTLKSLNQSVDLILVDGWPHLALDILKLVDPYIRKGGIVVTDNVRSFKEALYPYITYLQNPQNGYRTSILDLGGGTALAVKVI
ncbi:MAG: O-methyltransferase [Chloroflexi bacterium AL-W]|nr:O-methyltransferase [Chloroflexi bacterium AL-N1]NOK64986.1 O-methyltransferase [Chloroflexi bacterium AL-N10]NOK76756.1 O-methyltransferase [Chloroflexi bacterium AL-N5]NOK84647.1 O-methyltransferase [Chloroflexi bacterium AL-W]NOK86528.1 O-methyltransferase [Chloroflexi bacterium AL-N15]